MVTSGPLMTAAERAALDRERAAKFAARQSIPYSEEKFRELLAKSRAQGPLSKSDWTSGKNRLTSAELRFLLNQDNLKRFWGKPEFTGMSQLELRAATSNYPPAPPPEMIQPSPYQAPPPGITPAEAPGKGGFNGQQVPPGLQQYLQNQQAPNKGGQAASPSQGKGGSVQPAQPVSNPTFQRGGYG